MISFALDGISSFSVKPLKIISNLGIFISILSIAGLLYALISYLTDQAVAGWTAIVASIWLLGGIQMLCIGVVGGYIGKVYNEVKARPRFKIEEFLKKIIPNSPYSGILRLIFLVVSEKNLLHFFWPPCLFP